MVHNFTVLVFKILHVLSPLLLWHVKAPFLGCNRVLQSEYITEKHSAFPVEGSNVATYTYPGRCEGFPRWLSSRESVCSAGDVLDLDLVPESGRSPGGGHGSTFQLFLHGDSHGQSSLMGYIQSMGSQRVGRD